MQLRWPHTLAFLWSGVAAAAGCCERLRRRLEFVQQRRGLSAMGTRTCRRFVDGEGRGGGNQNTESVTFGVPGVGCRGGDAWNLSLRDRLGIVSQAIRNQHRGACEHMSNIMSVVSALFVS